MRGKECLGCLTSASFLTKCSHDAERVRGTGGGGKAGGGGGGTGRGKNVAQPMPGDRGGKRDGKT